MNSTFKTFLLAGAGALVVALGGAAAAQAGGYGPSKFNSFLLGGLSGDDDDDTYVASDSNPIADAVEAAATAAAVDTLLGAVDGDDD